MAYLDETNVFDTYRKAVAYMRPSFDPIDEQERIANNLPHPGIDPAYPKVTDGTTSSIVKKTGRRIVQQLPTGRVTSDTNDWLSIVASFVYLSKIIPNANEQYALLQKCWLMIDRALTNGASHSLSPFINRGSYFGPDMTIPYIKNVYFEPGKISDSDSNCLFVDAWYQPADLEAIIKKEKELAKSAKERGEKYEGTWDLKVLEELKLMVTNKTEAEESKHQGPKDSDTKSGIKLTHAFQRGVGATFYTIHDQSKQIARRKKNKDPRGEWPEQTMYFEIDGISPLGRGLVQQVAPLQNLMDAEMQMYQYNRALMLNPPLVKRGTWNKSQAKFAPNVLIDMGSDPNSSLDPLKIDSSAIANFPANYGLMKSQLLNLASSPDTSISAEVGNPGFSKTDSGVKQVAANVSVDDNYIRKQFETWFERWSETAINLYFAERTGTEELQLDSETAIKLRKLEQEGKLDPGFVSDDDKILINYDQATEALKFEVDASTSNMKNDAQQLEALDGLLGRLEASPVLQATIPQDKILGIWNAIVQSSGVENPEDSTIDIEEWKREQEEALAQEQMMAEQQMAQEQAMMGQAMQAPEGAELELPQEEMPMEEPQDMAPEDLAFMTALQDMGYTEDQILMAMALTERPDLSDEEILEMLGEPQDG